MKLPFVSVQLRDALLTDVQRGHVGRFAGEVLAPVTAGDRLAVAKEVVRGADARRDVLPVRHVVDGVVLTAADERNGGQRLRRHVRVVIIETHTVVQRELADRPAILRI